MRQGKRLRSTLIWSRIDRILNLIGARVFETSSECSAETFLNRFSLISAVLFIELLRWNVKFWIENTAKLFPIMLEAWVTSRVSESSAISKNFNWVLDVIHDRDSTANDEFRLRVMTKSRSKSHCLVLQHPRHKFFTVGRHESEKEIAGIGCERNEFSICVDTESCNKILDLFLQFWHERLGA